MLPQVKSLGPFLRGVVDGANTATDLTGYMRWARHGVLSGKGRLMAGPGSSVAITLMDDAGSPAPVTSVLAIVPFSDGALAVAHSTATQKVYLYRLDASLTGWYNLAGFFTASATATPLATPLWTTIASPPSVTISELLGQAYIAHNNALTASTLDWPTMVYTGAAINALTADIDGAGGPETIYALGTFAFHGHLWIWGFDKGAIAATAFRPELLRFGGPDGGLLTDDGKGSFTVGHRIRSAREAIVGACVAGEVAYIGTAFSLWPIVGYGRDSWDKSHPLDESYGFASLQGQVEAGNGTLYYWSPRGPARVTGLTPPEPLWDALPEAIPAVVDPQKIVASFDVDRDQVLWWYRSGGKSGNQLLAAYDTRRDCFLGPDTDQGILVGCAGLVGPVAGSAGAGAPGPTGPPTTASTTAVGSTSAIATWVNGDTAAETTTLIEYRVQGTTPWTSAGSASSGVASLTITGLSLTTAYEWRASHVRNSQQSTFLGPLPGSQFATGATLLPPTNIAGTYIRLKDVVKATWTNSGDSDVSTEIWYGYGSSAPTVWSLLTTVGVGVSSKATTLGAPPAGQDTWFQVRHVKSLYAPSAYNGPARCI